MKKFGKRQDRNIQDIDEEDVAKALLNKRTEVALYKETKTNQTKEAPMTQSQRQQAEQTLSSALDVLRQERGQKTIGEEEVEYSFNEQLNRFDDLVGDVTSKNFMDDIDPSLNIVHQALEESSQEKEDETPAEKVLSFTKKKKKSNKKKKGDTQKIKKEDTQKIKKQEEKSDKKKKKKKEKKKMSPVIKVIIVLVLLGLACMGGYAYKIYVYDPANVVSEEQQDAYDRLIAYADEYDMMSDSEKLELLDMQDDYECLLDKQKSSLNDYFKDENHVGKTYKALIKELKALKESMEDESNEGYQNLKTYLENWETYEDITKREIINYKTIYDGLSTSLQKKIDDIARVHCTKSFVSVYSEYHEMIVNENNILIEANNQQIEQLQAQKDQEQTTLDEYNKYGESLQSDLETAQKNNQDTSSIQSQIDTNNQMKQQSQQTIDSLQQQIDQLNAENEQLANVA